MRGKLTVHVYGKKLAGDWLEVAGWLAPVIGVPAARWLGGWGLRWLVWGRIGWRVYRLLPNVTLVSEGEG